MDSTLNEDLISVVQTTTAKPKRVVELIRQGANLQYQNIDGATALHLAASKGHNEICKILLENGAAPNILSKWDWSPLGIAIDTGNDILVLLLLEKGADPNLKTEVYGNALDCAMKKNAKDNIFTLLIEHGADVDNVQGHRTLLHWARENGNKDLVSFLLRKRVNTEATNENEWKTMHFARKNNYKERVDMLGKEYSFRQFQIFHASREGNYHECQALLENETIVHSTHYGPYCPIAVASHKGHFEIVKLFMEKRAIIDYENNNARNPLYLATKKGHTNIASLLLEKGGNGNIQVNGDTLLHVATRNNHVDLVRVFLQKGVNPNVKDNEGYTALHYAVVDGNQDMVTSLIEHSANINLTTDNLETPLHLACETGHEQIVQVLLVNGANPDALNDRNENPKDIIHRKSSETELESQNKLKIMNDIDKLLTTWNIEFSLYFVGDNLTENGSISKERSKKKGCATAGNLDTSSECSDSDATVEYSLSSKDPIKRDLSSPILKTSDIEDLNNKMARLSVLISELNEKVVNLELLKTDLELESFTFINLNRKLEHTQVLKALNAEDSNALIVYEDALRKLTEKVDNTEQMKFKLEDDVEEMQTVISQLQIQVRNVYREIGRFITIDNNVP